MKLKMLLLAFGLAALISALAGYNDAGRTHSYDQTGGSELARAQAYLKHLRYPEAESTLSILVRSAEGEVLQEALFHLAGLKTSAEEAGILYRQIIDEDPRSRWSHRAQLELAKIQYALGSYDEAMNILEDSGARDESDEARLFYGLSAVMLHRYEEAKQPLLDIRRGKLRTWAYLSLAEVEAGLNRPDEACRRYEALSSAMISPTALYRFAECLEDLGNVERASEEFAAIIKNFQDTPEAVLAAEKLQLFAAPAAEQRTAESDHVEVLTSGFTIQFGSFRDRGNAIKLAAKLKRVFPGTRVDSELINFREHHRVRYGYFRTREQAQAKGEEISREMNEDFTIMSLP
jgi:TolA-binding protein